MEINPINPNLGHHDLDDFSQNLKKLEQCYTDGNSINSQLPYLRINGLEGIFNHGIFGTSDLNPTVQQPQQTADVQELLTVDQFKETNPTKKRKKPPQVYSNHEKHFKCTECAFATHNKYNLENHMLRHADPTTTKVYKCPECDYSSLIKRNVDRHAKKHKTGIVLKCDKCSYETVQCHEFKRHRHTHFQVDIRHEILVKNRIQGVNLVKNDTAEITDTVYRCDECLYACHNIKYLKNHKINKHQIGKPCFKCEICGFETTNEKYLEKHKRNLHNEGEAKLYACKKCSFTSKYRTCVAKHQKVHLGEEGLATIYYCYNCSFHSIHKGSLIKHMPIHRDQPMDDKPMLQCDFCSYQTKRKDALNRHQTVHQNRKKLYKPRTYQCKKCGLPYKSRKEWFRHVLNDCKMALDVSNLLPEVEVCTVSADPIKIEEQSGSESE